jgi:uncharacterized protein (DUF362 family)
MGRWIKEVMDHGMSRRDFLMATGVVSLSLSTLGCVRATGPSPSVVATPLPPGPMVVATDADPSKLVDRALDAFGGLSGVIKKGDKVAIKVNFTFARTKEQAASNHPQVLVRLMERCRDAGASNVIAFDHTLDNPELCLERSGIKAAVEKAGFKVQAVSDEGDYSEKPIPGPALKKTKIARLLDDADVFIDAPVIKSHSSTRLTASMKNLMGIIWDRQAFHRADLDACIADLAAYARPSLIMADAYRVLKTGGPGGGGPGDQIVQPHRFIVGRDPVAVDSYAATLLGLKGSDIDHIMKAYSIGLGEYNLDNVDIRKVGSS